VSLLGERTPESCNIAANTLKILALRQDNKVTSDGIPFIAT
jgi:hypothetical protein